MPGAPSSFLLLAAMPGAPSSVLAPSSDRGCFSLACLRCRKEDGRSKVPTLLGFDQVWPKEFRKTFSAALDLFLNVLSQVYSCCFEVNSPSCIASAAAWTRSMLHCCNFATLPTPCAACACAFVGSILFNPTPNANL